MSPLNGTRAIFQNARFHNEVMKCMQDETQTLAILATNKAAKLTGVSKQIPANQTQQHLKSYTPWPWGAWTQAWGEGGGRRGVGREWKVAWIRGIHYRM